MMVKDLLIGEIVDFKDGRKATKFCKERVAYYHKGSQGRYGKFNYYPSATYTFENGVYVIK